MSKYDDKKKSGVSEPNYHEGNLSRGAQESSEGLKTVLDNTAPETRYDNTQQVGEVKTSADVSTPRTGFTKKTLDKSGSSVKQTVASKLLLADSDYAGVAGGSNQSASRSGLKTMSYSGDAGSILGNAANTPVVGTPSRSSGRFEKQLDAASKKINFLASEQVVTHYDNPKPLGESADEPQGYYGTPKNTNIRSQKSAGGTPASLLVERSADEILHDSLVFVEGQYVKSSDPSLAYNVEPTKVSTFQDGIRQVTDLTGDNVITYGNYLNREVKFTFSKTASGQIYLSKIKYNSTDCSRDDESAATVNCASTNWIIGMNMDEIARQRIDSNAGQETKLEWSPLGRGVLEPTATVGLLRRFENDLGANIFTAYKFANKTMSYQLNKAAKDGQRLVAPAREWLIGSIAPYLSSADFYSDSKYYNGFTSPFDKSLYKAGCASLLIALFDSTGKYSDKADFLLQPKGLRSAFQIADNNMDVFRVSDTFVAALNNIDVFSTIDRGYDPMMPVCVTDKVGLISSFSYDRFGSCTFAADGTRTADYTPFTYAYANRSSNYEIEVVHPLLSGIEKFMKQYAPKIYRLLATDAEFNSNTDVTLSVPIVYSTVNASLWEFLLLRAVPFMQKERINAMRDILDYEVNFEYPFALSKIADANPTNAVNYTFKSIGDPLESRQMIASTAIKWIMPEFVWTTAKANDKYSTRVLPWYFSEMQFEPGSVDAKGYGATSLEQDLMSGVMSMPVIRDGVRLGYLDDIYSMSERDVRLCLDRMVRIPFITTGDVQYNVYKYGQANEGIPALKFNGKYSLFDYISTPRELGWFMDAPFGLLSCVDNLVANAKKVGFDTFAALDDECHFNTSFRLRCWKGTTNVKTAILQANDVNISRSQAFRQYWDITPAYYMAPIGSDNKTYRARLDVGFLPSLRQMYGVANYTTMVLNENQGSFKPFTVGYSVNPNSIQAASADDSLYVMAMHKGLWGRIQRIPMVLSPWDTCDILYGVSDTAGTMYDPYDLAYMFGCAGMMASDYNQDIYNRTNQVQDQGWLYTVDPFVQASPIFKDSVRFTL